MTLLGSIIKKGVEMGAKFNNPELEPFIAQRQALKKILSTAAQTSFGKAYDFDHILAQKDILQAYKTLPVFDYDKIHNEWWYRNLQGEENVCWPGKIPYFALSSGTSGAPSKQIPVSEDMLKSVRKVGIDIFANLRHFTTNKNIYTKRMMMLTGSAQLEEKDGLQIGDLSGINAKKIPTWFRGFYKPGKRIAEMKEWEERIQEIAKNAPKWDIGYIMGIPAWNQLMLERIIAYHKVDTIHDIWPNLEIFITGGVAFEPYKKSFERLTNKPLCYIDTYLASEGFIAVQSRSDTNAMQLVFNHGIYYEFVPFNADNFDSEGNIKEQPTSYCLEEIEEGVDYALLLTTCSGNYRYLIGDTLRFTDKKRFEIRITGRTKQFLSICGEHLSIDNMNEAVQRLEEKFDVGIPEFCVSGIKSGNYFSHKWFLCMEKPMDKNLLKKHLDQFLCEINDDYKTERKAVLKDIEIEILPSQTIYNWHRSKNKIGGQNKFPRVLNPNQREAFEAFLKTQMEEA